MEEEVLDRLIIWCSDRNKDRAIKKKRFREYLNFFKAKITFDIIKVTGTNGKGSVVSMLSACVTKDGKTAGLFTSPHLISVTERFRVNDKEVSLDEVLNIALKIEILARDVVNKKGADYIPSFFEVLVLIAIEIFNNKGVEIAIFEGGIGGDNDVTSLFDGFLTLVTSIGLDHQKQLGDTLEKVAIDKSGMCSDNSVLIVNSMIPQNLKAIIKHEVSGKNVDFVEARDFVKYFETNLNGSYALVEINGTEVEIKPSLLGYFQKQNLNLVIETWLFLKKSGKVENIDSLFAVESTNWNARFEVIKLASTWILDSAHNPQAFSELTQSLNMVSSRGERVLLFGNSEEKDFMDILKVIPAISDIVYFIDDFYKSVPQPSLINNYDKNLIMNTDNSTIPAAIEDIEQKYKNKIIVVAGSIFMVGSVRHKLMNK